MSTISKILPWRLIYFSWLSLQHCDNINIQFVFIKSDASVVSAWVA